MSSSIEALTRHFYEWEMRGRGWQVESRPIALEPPFRPFFGHFVAGPPGAVIDDGRRPTALTGFIDGLFKSRGKAKAEIFPEEVEPDPVYVDAPGRVLEIQAVLPWIPRSRRTPPDNS